MGKRYTGIRPMQYTLSLLIMGVVVMLFSVWFNANIYDWPSINAKLDRLAELEPKIEMYEAMHEMNVGVYCELAVHYEWTPEEDRQHAADIIARGVHD